MAQGNKRPLEMNDLWHIEKPDKMSPLSQRFQAVYREEAAKAVARYGVFLKKHIYMCV